MFIVIGCLIMLGIAGLLIDKQYEIDQEDPDWHHYED